MYYLLDMLVFKFFVVDIRGLIKFLSLENFEKWTVPPTHQNIHIQKIKLQKIIDLFYLVPLDSLAALICIFFINPFSFHAPKLLFLLLRVMRPSWRPQTMPNTSTSTLFCRHCLMTCVAWTLSASNSPNRRCWTVWRRKPVCSTSFKGIEKSW